MPLDVTPLLNLGAVGCVLGWFLLQTNPRLERIERALDRLTKAIMLDLVARPDVADPIKEQARSIVRDIDANQPARDRDRA